MPQPDTIVDVGFAVAAIMAAIWLWVPPLLSLCGLGIMDCRAYGSPRDTEPDGNDPIYEDAFRQLQKLGFQPLGLSRETTWFANGHWRQCYPEQRNFGSPDGDCFAIVYRVEKWAPVNIGFQTVIEGDVVAFSTTSDVEAGSTPDYAWNCVDSRDLSFVLSTHRKLVADMTNEDAKPVEHRDLNVAADHERLCLDKHKERGLFRRTSVVLLSSYATISLLATVGCASAANWERPVLGVSIAILTSVIVVCLLHGRQRFLTQWEAWRKSTELRRRLAKSGTLAK
ncbi:MAG: hypothetical protein N2C14_21755 [Planctomycetales bacterium]